MGALLAKESTESEETTNSSLDNLPVELQLACLARVPYKDLREVVACTCKSWRNLVATEVFRKTREAAGFAEWAVFAGSIGHTASCYLITASGAHRTAQRPPVRNLFTMRLSSASGDVVAVLEPDDGPSSWEEGPPGTMRAHSFDPRRNRWSPIAPIVGGQGGNTSLSLREDAGVGSVGNKIYVLGGAVGVSISTTRAFSAYDAATGEWSQLPNLPFKSAYTNTVEVDGRLWCYASTRLEGRTQIYDPEAESWTQGPDLPHELFGIDEAGTYHCTAYELRGRFCVLAKFQGNDNRDAYSGERYSYRTFAWDPTSEEWEENPFPLPPQCATRCASVDDYLVAFGSEPVGGVDYGNPQDLLAYQQGQTTRLHVLAPGATVWAEWRLPADCSVLGTRTTAVCIG